MVGAEDVGAVLEVLLLQGDCFVNSSCILVGDCEVVACGEDMRVVGSQDVDAVLKVLLVQGDGFVESASSLVGVGEVVA